MKKSILLFLIIIMIILTLALFFGYLYFQQKDNNSKQLPSNANSCISDSSCSLLGNNKICYNGKCVDKTPEMLCYKAGQFWCKEKNICIDSFLGYCISCMGLENNRCSCMINSTDSKTEGSECITSSGQMGECKSGSCTEVIGRPVSDNRIIPNGNLNVGIIELQLSDTNFGYFKDCNGYLQDNAQGCDGEKKYDYLDLLNNKNKITKVIDNKGEFDVHSLYYIKDWYKNQAENYNANLDIDVDIKGPYIINTEPPKRNLSDTTKFNNFFENSASSNGVNLNDYDIVIFIYFNDLRSGARFESNYHRPKTAYIDAFTDIFSAYNENIVESILHEMGHGFGAGDDYIGYSCTDAGKSNEPYTACLMCSICENSDCGHDLQNSNPLVTQLKVCDLTAKQFGWK